MVCIQNTIRTCTQTVSFSGSLVSGQRTFLCVSSEGEENSADFRAAPDRGISDTINDFSDSIVRWGEEAFSSFNRERQQLNKLLKNRANRLSSWIQRNRGSFDDFRSYDPSPVADISAPKGFVCSLLPPNAGKKAWAAVSGQQSMRGKGKIPNYFGWKNPLAPMNPDGPASSISEESMDPWEKAKGMGEWLRKQKNRGGDFWSRRETPDLGLLYGGNDNPSLDPDEMSA